MTTDVEEIKGSELTPEIIALNDQMEAVKSFMRTGPIRRKLYSLMELYHMYVLNQHGHLPTEFDDIAIDMLDLFRFLRDLSESGKNMSEEEW
jgi:hypothetical protein